MRARSRSRRGGRPWLAGVAAVGIASSSCLQIAGFDDFTFETPAEPTFGALRDVRPQKMDILLVLDDSGSGAPALALLTSSLRRLFGEILNPPCESASGERSRVAPTERCPDGTVRTSAVVPDVHVGIVTSALGTYGVEICGPTVDGNRRGHLYWGNQPSWNDSGVFVYDLLGSHDPPGSADPDALAASIEAAAADLLSESPSCGIEQQLEAWFHFLVDPEPRSTGEVGDAGEIDQTLLDQRAAFLRPDSVLFVVVVSDENDGSMDPMLASYLLHPSSAPLPPTTACAVDPDSPCCAPCLDDRCYLLDCDDPACADVTCEEAVETPFFQIAGWDSKRRYGIDPYRPTSRYVDALSAPMLETADGPVANPLLVGRRPEDVYFTTLSGVPWQDIARLRNGQPDMLAGLDASGEPRGGLMTGAELVASDAWRLLVGYAPEDPHMIWTPRVRTEIDPRTGKPLPGPDAPAFSDPIHGHEVDTAMQDFQHACLGPLPQSLACDPAQGCLACSGSAPSPVCDDPATGENDPTTQFWSYAYPGTRYLEVARALGDQAIVGSLCAVQVDDPESPDYGFTPAIVGGISDKLRPRLRAPACGPKLPSSTTARSSCRVWEARAGVEGTCNCPALGRADLPTDDGEDDAIRDSIQRDPRFGEEAWTCYCEIPAVAGDGLEPCRNQPDDIVTDENGYLVSGWCAIEEGDAALDAFPDACDEGETALRFVGDGRPLPGAAVFVDCR